jgi:hypothetical protein
MAGRCHGRNGFAISVFLLGELLRQSAEKWDFFFDSFNQLRMQGPGNETEDNADDSISNQPFKVIVFRGILAGKENAKNATEGNDKNGDNSIRETFTPLST